MSFKTGLAFLLNTPFTIIGLLLALIYIPYKVIWNRDLAALILYVRYDRFTPLPYMKGWRAMALGHAVIMGPREKPLDLEHELIHVEQHIRYPFIFIFLNYIELVLHGYRNNRFENEAYTRAGNIYESSRK